jgi:threonine/homoserine/homoserine lactone efflux protein
MTALEGLRLGLSLLPFAVAMMLTPGPNNVVIAAVAANFGFRATIPYLAGTAIGILLLLTAVGSGLGALFVSFPELHAALKVAGAAYLIWLAWRIAGVGRVEQRAVARPLFVIEGVVFQWLNPKAWVMAVGAFATFSTVGGEVHLEAIVIIATFGLVIGPSIGAWALLGAWAGRRLEDVKAMRHFNRTMAALLIASIVLVI